MTAKPPALPEDTVTLQDLAEEHGISVLTFRSWKVRHKDTPAPWRPARRNGEPDLYLRSDWVAWMREHGRGGLCTSASARRVPTA